MKGRDILRAMFLIVFNIGLGIIFFMVSDLLWVSIAVIGNSAIMFLTDDELKEKKK